MPKRPAPPPRPPPPYRAGDAVPPAEPPSFEPPEFDPEAVDAKRRVELAAEIGKTTSAELLVMMGDVLSRSVFHPGGFGLAPLDSQRLSDLEWIRRIVLADEKSRSQRRRLFTVESDGTPEGTRLLLDGEELEAPITHIAWTIPGPDEPAELELRMTACPSWDPTTRELTHPIRSTLAALPSNVTVVVDDPNRPERETE